MNRLFTLLFACVVAVSLSADPVSKESARKSAECFLQQKGLQMGGEAACARGGRTATGHQALYVFNTVDDRGFVIVSGDDCAESILGYTTRGSYDEAMLPDNFRNWLDQVSAEIEAVSKLPKPKANVSGVAPAPQKVNIHAAIQPLIITTWNQGNTDNVYNAHLPLVNGQHPCTGCVATAGAQVMYYYRWPEGPTQVVPGYQLTDVDGRDISHGADTSADLPSITFQWDKMKTNYSYREETAPLTEAEAAVADLMLYTSYAAEMDYGLSEMGGSGASSSTLAEGMCKYFDYNPNTWKDVYRSYYSVVEWDELIYNELANGRPVIYSGTFMGGHSFICDGYDGAGMYHFNWGWSGSCNGYFKLHATSPYGKSLIGHMGYIADQDCIIGLQPNSWSLTPTLADDDEWEVPFIEGVVATASNVQVEDMTVRMNLQNDNDEDVAFGYGMGELNSDGSITVVNTDNVICNGSVLPKGYTHYNIAFDFSTYDLSEGSHTLVPICQVKGETEWKRCRPADVYFDVTVSGGEKTIIAHPFEDIEISDFDLATACVPGTFTQGVRFTVTNHGDNIEKTFTLYKGTADQIYSVIGQKTIKIAAGNTKTFSASLGYYLRESTYTIYLNDSYSGQVYAKKEINISYAQDLTATSFDIPGVKFKNLELEVHVTVENHGIDYASPLYLFASQTESKNNFVYAAGTAIEREGSEVVKFYFKPGLPGTWNLWVTTDPQGNNVIGEGTVVIDEPPTGPVTLAATNQKAVFGKDNVTYSFTAQNTGSTTNYRDLYVSLDVYDATGGSRRVTYKSPSLILEPGEEKTVTVYFDRLEEGANYTITSYYHTTYESSLITQFDSYEFTFVKSSGGETAKGDVNDDGKVNGTDIQTVINVITDEDYVEAADINKDGKVNGTDIQEIINIIIEE